MLGLKRKDVHHHTSLCPAVFKVKILKSTWNHPEYSVGRQPEETQSSVLICYKFRRVGNTMYVSSYAKWNRKEEPKALRPVCWVEQAGEWQRIRDRERRALLLLSNSHQIPGEQITVLAVSYRVQLAWLCTQINEEPCFEYNINPILILFKASKQFIYLALSVDFNILLAKNIECRYKGMGRHRKRKMVSLVNWISLIKFPLNSQSIMESH